MELLVSWLSCLSVMANNRFERDRPTAGFARCRPTPQAARYAGKYDVVLEDNNLRIANGSDDEKKR